MQTLASGIATLLVVASLAALALEPSGQSASHRIDQVSRRPSHVAAQVSGQDASAMLATHSLRLPTSATPHMPEIPPDPTALRPPPAPDRAADVPSHGLAATRPALAEPVSRIPSAGNRSTGVSADVGPTATPVAPARANVQWLPITRLQIPSIGLATGVVPAPLIEVGGERTWKVPSFSVGHGQYTAGAGQVGNAVLLGHVASLRDGSVFRNLHRIHVGDTVRVFSGEQQFEYRVVQMRVVSPTDVSVLRPTGVASLIMITCAGVWVPSLDDYSERLVVRADLVASRN